MQLTKTGERQVGTKLGEIRVDHRHRYEFAAHRLGAGKKILDAGCGVGYGSSILAEAGNEVVGVDVDADSIAFALEHWSDPNLGRVEFREEHLYHLTSEDLDAVICFETLEHVAAPDLALRRFHAIAPLLFLSVPNEEVLPFNPDGAPFHMRHYRVGELEELLEENGWRPVEWFGQENEMSPVFEGAGGRTLVVMAERCDLPPSKLLASDQILERQKINGRLPESVSIVAMGPSNLAYLAACSSHGNRRGLTAETWVVNAMAGVVQADRAFAMDDLAMQLRRAAAAPGEHVAGTLDAYKDLRVPLYTPRAYPDEFPTSVEYPLEWVIQRCGHAYFNNTVPYMVAYAIALGSVKELHFYGIDYTYTSPANAGKMEAGRGCVEYWIGIAHERGIATTIAAKSALLDAAKQGNRTHFYGYHTEHLTLEIDPTTGFHLSRVDRRDEDIDSVDVLNLKYCHDPRVEALIETLKGET